MAPRRLGREEFFAKLDGLDEAGLRKALWTLYWRGSAVQRERVETVVNPRSSQQRGRTVAPPPDATAVLDEVTEFATLARSGAYLAGDRRVSKKQRTQWRHTFRRLAGQAQDALRGDESGNASAAVVMLVDLACQTRAYDLFRSDDPMEAARFVVSDAVTALWTATRDAYGAAALIEYAPKYLVRWESRFGWTR